MDCETKAKLLKHQIEKKFSEAKNVTLEDIKIVIFASEKIHTAYIERKKAKRFLEIHGQNIKREGSCSIIVKNRCQELNKFLQDPKNSLEEIYKPVYKTDLYKNYNVIYCSILSMI